MDLVARLLITLIVVAFAAMSARIVMRTIQRRNRLIAVERGMCGGGRVRARGDSHV